VLSSSRIITQNNMKVPQQQEASAMVATRVATGVTEGVSEKDEVVPQMDRSHESGSSSMPVLESDRPVCRENKTESTSWAKVSLKRNEMNKVLLDRYLCPEHFDCPMTPAIFVSARSG